MLLLLLLIVIIIVVIEGKGVFQGKVFAKTPWLYQIPKFTKTTTTATTIITTSSITATTTRNDKGSPGGVVCKKSRSLLSPKAEKYH